MNDMNEFRNKNSESKWDILNQAFLIEKLADQAYSEIYQHNNDPWKALRKISKKTDYFNDPLKIYLLYQELYNKLELPEKQILARHFGQ